jgi:hypothetical protein
LLHPNHRPTHNHLTSPNPVTELSPSVNWSAVDIVTRQLHRGPTDRHAEVVPDPVEVEVAVAPPEFDRMVELG